VGVILPISRALIVIALITSMRQDAQAFTRESSPVRRVLVLGDSLSEGFRLFPRDAWPMLVAEKLRRIDARFQVINASVSGGTTTGGLRRLPAYLGNKVDIFVLELGINDAFQGVPIEQIRQNSQSIIDKVKARHPNAAIVVVGMQFPIVTNDDDYVTAFGRMFGEVAHQNHAVLVPYLLQGVSGDPALNLEDRIHPNAAGHQILAETVWRVLEPVARELAAK
jgi:acyl-CoA thioesterase I